MFKQFLIWCLLLAGSMVFSQEAPTFAFDLDDCTLTDHLGNDRGIVSGTQCSCGVSEDAPEFDGNNGFAEFDTEVNDIFRGDWSMSFYIQIRNSGTESVDLLYLGNTCSRDSVLSLRYLPGSQRFRLLVSSSGNNSVQLDGLADNNSCWQYIAITKELAVVSLYINGILVDQGAAVSDLAFEATTNLGISNSPCQNIATSPDVNFVGLIDEIRFFSRVLTSREILDADFMPDKIITSDTTTFIGASIQLQTGGSCSSDFQWSPSEGLSNTSVLNPTASPSSDVTYTFTVNGEGCTSTDEVTIRVADPASLTCEDLLLPSAFTPNNDRINDRYGISNQFLISQLLSFEIFNKWGGRVFSTKLPGDTWDGLYQGSPAPPNSYIYRVEYICEGQQYTKTGSVNLLR